MPERRLRPRLPDGRRVDLAVAAVLASALVVELLVRPGAVASPQAIAFAIGLAATVAARRTQPLAAICLAAAITVAIPDYLTQFANYTPVVLASVLSYACGAYAGQRYGVLGVIALACAMQEAVGFSEFPNLELGAVTLGPWWASRQVRRRRTLVSELAARTRELEAEQDAFTRLSVRRERGRIARELHDIVAHQLAVMVIQAGAGRMAAPGRRDGAAGQFATIRDCGAQALAEMARLVDILLADSTNAGDDRLQNLIDQAQAGGLRLHVEPLPAGAPLPAAVQERAYRVVQEGLTNAMKHAPGADVHVRLVVEGDVLEIEVRDEGGTTAPTLADSGSGLGLRGMRERLQAGGGSLAAGPDGDGGWCVRARLPILPPVVAQPR